MSSSFSSLPLSQEILQAIASVGWTSPTPIQTESIPHALLGKDLIALASTGSGKTGAFAIPILEQLLKAPQRMYALVLAPTRELCVQISEQFIALGASIGLETAVLVGGLDMTSQALSLAKRPHVIVGSPGRVVDHLENTKGFNLKNIKFLVLDEADRLLSMDFEEELDKIIHQSSSSAGGGGFRQTFLFSATMTSKVHKLERAALKNPIKIEVNQKNECAENLKQFYILMPLKFKQTYMAWLLSDRFSAKDKIIIFVETCLNAQRITATLRHLGFPAVCLHGQMSQQQRLGALGQFKAGQKTILVATDVAARGLDIPLVGLVINYELPKSEKDYIHRVGRTARAGKEGVAINLISQYDVEQYQRIEKHIDMKLGEYAVEEVAVMALHERVQEASRLSHMEMKEKEEEVKLKLKAGGHGKGNSGRARNKAQVKKMMLR